jgi:hypothetical protein
VSVPSDQAENETAALHKRDEKLTEITTTLAVHAWMLGVVITLYIAILGTLLLH